MQDLAGQLAGLESAGMADSDEMSKVEVAEEARQKGSLFSSTTEGLRQLILDGVLPAGQRLKERELCDQLGVSRTPVREAIKALTQEGLLLALPNRSAIVAALNPEEVRSLAVVVAEVERLAVELACEAATEADLEGIIGAHHQMIICHVRGDLREYFKANKEFHRQIILSTRNSVLLWIWNLLSVRVDRARYASNLQPKRWPVAMKEHNEILEVLIARDAARASVLMKSHVLNGLSAVISSLSETESAGGEGLISSNP
jgi:DNA-binding GntR family transcriptional regulator